MKMTNLLIQLVLAASYLPTLSVAQSFGNPRCDVCGSSTARISNPESLIPLSDFGVSAPIPVASCQQIFDGGISGFVPADSCPQLQASSEFKEFCGCFEPNAPTPPPISPTRVPTTRPPTPRPTRPPATKPPTRKPTSPPTTKAPTRKPTAPPTTKAPTRKPTTRPTTKAPTRKPTTRPTTKAPTPSPVASPNLEAEMTNSTSSPIISTTKGPTKSPTTKSPTTKPPITTRPDETLMSESTSISTSSPTIPLLSTPAPSPAPTNNSSSQLTAALVTNTTGIPTRSPTNLASNIPSEIPTSVPSHAPSNFPSDTPSDAPSLIRSVSPTILTPTRMPLDVTGGNGTYPICYVCNQSASQPSNPTKMLSIPSEYGIPVSEASCFQIYDVGLSGLVPPNGCPLIQTNPTFNEVCQCETVPTASPVTGAPTVTSPPTVLPTLSTSPTIETPFPTTGIDSAATAAFGIQSTSFSFITIFMGTIILLRSA